MGQEEITIILKKEKRPMSMEQIAKLVGERTDKISHLLSKLLKHNEIKCFELDRFEAAEYLGRKIPQRRMRFYYVCSETGKIIPGCE